MASAGGGSTSDASFGKFKTTVADHFGKDDAVKVAVCLNLTPARIDEIKYAKAPGLTLLNHLHKDDIIMEDDINKLCDALKHCRLNRAARIATQEFEKYKSYRERGMVDGPSRTGDDMDSHPASYDPGTVKNILQNELTRHDCFELAIYFSLSDQVVNTIQESRSYVKNLFDALEDLTVINERNISALLIALKDRGLLRVANKIKGALEQQHFVTTDEEGPATLRQDEGSGDSLKCRMCGTSSFHEFKNEDRIVAIECQNGHCWIITSTRPSKERITVEYNNQTWLYKPPVTLDLNKMEYKAVEDIKELKPGDHIIFRRKIGFVGMYDHHAILVSTKDSSMLDVIHWTSGKPSSSSFDSGISIRREKVPAVRVRRVVYHQEDPKDLVLARAFTLLQKSDQFYSLSENNCESLATYCKSGVFFSVQGQLLKKFLPFFQRGMSLFTW